MRLHLALLALVFALPLNAQIAPCLAENDGPAFEDRSSMGGPNLTIAFKVQAPATGLVIHAIQVFTGEQSGQNTVAIWTHEASSDSPGTELSRGAWSMSRVNNWQGSNLDQPVSVAADAWFWVAWSPIDRSQASTEGHNLSNHLQYRGSFDGGQSWNGPYTNNDWKFRVWCHPVGAADFRRFGGGCPGDGGLVPSLVDVGPAQVGVPYVLRVRDARPARPAFACVGFDASLWAGSVPLPFDAAPLGAPGCLLYVDPALALSSSVTGAGEASASFVVPADVALIGFGFYQQWLVADEAANRLGLAVSDAATVIIGGWRPARRAPTPAASAPGGGRSAGASRRCRPTRTMGLS